MDRKRMQNEQQWIREQLNRCADFWLKNGMDPIHGGVYTCLDRTGKIYSTDKSVWMQGRCGWTFSYLCHVYGVKEEWLKAAKSCIDFLENHCINHEAGGRLYFTVTVDGQPLRQRRYCFSEAFYCMANAEYYGITGETEHLLRARRAYDMYWNLNHGMEDPTKMGPKTVAATRSGRSLGIPMILLNVTSILKRVDPEQTELYDARANEYVQDISRYHVKPELGCTLESVASDGAPRLNITEGRMVNPGHDIECAWFLMERANQTGDKELHAKAIEVFDMAFAKGWDKEYGGIGGTYGAMPELFVKLEQLVNEGNMEAARLLQYDINNIIYTLCSGTGNMYGMIKSTLKKRAGLELGGVRPPLLNLTAEDDAIAEKACAMIEAAIAKHI